MTNSEKIIILNFGSPYNQLLTREIRALGVYSELHPYNISASEIKQMNPAGIIISDGPHRLNDDNDFRLDEEIYQLGIPMLGINYGMHLMNDYFGGKIATGTDQDYEAVTIQTESNALLLKDTPITQSVWMRVGDQVSDVPASFLVDATSKSGQIVAMSDVARNLFGVQFNPEVEETEHGTHLFKQFLFTVCKCAGEWSIQTFINNEVARIKERVGDRNVLCGLSGGVDSSVVAALIHKAIGNQLTCVFIDHGLLRKNEAADVMKLFADDFKMNIIKVDAEERFLSKLMGIDDPEEKRKIIGNEFIEVFDDEAGKLNDIHFLAQGTLYSDVIESGTETSETIKSHHNVGGLPENMELELIEPLRTLFKDEVRELGTALEMPDHIVWRQPFPGPGLAIRILGDVTKKKIRLVRESDAILREEIAKAGLERDIWQYFTVLPNIRSVGVTDDVRTYDYTIGIRAVTSIDGMTSDWARIPWDVLDNISRRIVAEVGQINRVVYDVTSKPPSTIEWE